MAKNVIVELNNLHNLLIIGNGFDLHLKLKSSFSNFFEQKYLDRHNVFKQDCINIFAYLLYIRFYAKNISNSFMRRIYKFNPNWMDIESFIKKLATDHVLFSKIFECISYKDKTAYPSSFTKYSIYLSNIFKRKLSGSEFDYNTLDKVLSDDLSEFEEDFAAYMKETLVNRPNYESDALDLVDKIINSISNFDNSLEVQIINFNYTKIHCRSMSEANIHGTLYDKVVIGYDSTTSPIGDKDVFQLSKDWRKLDIPFEYSYPFSSINSIIVYGHSLGEQDYPYFFEIFDKCDFLSNESIKLFLCYSLHGATNYEKKSNFDNYKMNASKMLNAYERYKNPSKTRNSIVSSLKLNKRIEFVNIV